MSFRTGCCKKVSLIFALLTLAVLAAPAFAQTCLQNEYNQVQKQKLNCTANDVRIAEVTNIRDPLTGNTLASCIGGSTFNFLADFEIVTTSSQARENIGLYIATASTTQALTGACVDKIISAQHQCPGAPAGILCGSDNYHETDPAPDNCGDTSSNDNSATFGPGAEKVTLEIDNFLCNPPAGSDHLVLPNCTSWQIPGGTIQCVSGSPDTYPFNGPNGTPTAIPGSPSKCNCGVIPLAITVQKPSINVTKNCTTANGTGTLPNPSCTLTPEGGQVTYTVDMINDKSNFGSVVIDQICDSAYGNVFTVSGFSGPACAAGSTGQTITGTNCTNFTIAFGADQTCTFTADQPESTTVTDTVQVSGHGLAAGTFGPTSTNSVVVTSNEASTTGTITKGFGGNTAGCATVRYNVTVTNTSATGTDETLSLSALNDTAFGSITSVHDSVLGTTCGVATGSPGLGTLSGLTGAGALPATIPVNNGAYTCQFDGNFCSGLDANGCFSHTNTVSATLTGDENEVVSLTPGTLNVKECLAGSVVP